MKFKTAKFLLCGLLFSWLSAQTFTSSQTYTGNTIDSIDIQANNITVTFTAPNLTIGSGGISALNRSGVTIKFSNTSLTSVIINGDIKLTGTTVGGVTIDGPGTTGTLYTNGNVFLKNAAIQNFAIAINTQQSPGGKNFFLEKTLLKANNNALVFAGLPVGSFNARFSAFQATGSAGSHYSMVMNNTAPMTNFSAEFCYFYKNGGANHIYVPGQGVNGTANLEGSSSNGAFSVGGSSPLTYDNNPLSTGTDPISGILTFGANGTGTAGINYNKIIPPNTTLDISNSLTFSNGLQLGYDSDTNTYPGGTTLRVANGQSLTIQGNLVSSGNATNYLRAGSGNWGGLILSGGSTEIYNTSFIDATKSVQDKANGTRIERSSFSGTGAGPFVEIDHVGTSAYRGNNFSAIGSYNTGGSMVILAGDHIVNGNTFSGTSPAALRVNLNTSPANEISGNTISFASGGYGIRVENTGSPRFTNNTITGIGDAIQITNGTPSFSGNTISGGNLNISGTAGKSLYFQNNIFSAGAKVAANADTTAGTYYNLINNNWNQIPAIANYSGTSEIRYEPWTGNGTKQAPMAITGAVPANNATTINPVTALTFTVDDIGYHNGTPLQYRLYITGPAGYTAYADTVQPTFHGRGSSVTFTIPALNVPREPGDYYWSVSVNNRISDDGNWGGSPLYKFTITRPNVLLNLSRPASAAQASAGEQVDYTVTFTNAETGTDMRNVVISTILPEEVYWNGVLNFSGAAAMGNISVRAFSTINRSDSDFVTLNAGTNPTNITGIVPAADNTKVKRLDVVITNLPRQAQSGYTGSFVYQTIVK